MGRNTLLKPVHEPLDHRSRARAPRSLALAPAQPHDRRMRRVTRAATALATDRDGTSTPRERSAATSRPRHLGARKRSERSPTKKASAAPAFEDVFLSPDDDGHGERSGANSPPALTLQAMAVELEKKLRSSEERAREDERTRRDERGETRGDGARGGAEGARTVEKRSTPTPPNEGAAREGTPAQSK